LYRKTSNPDMSAPNISDDVVFSHAAKYSIIYC
jgi:hypothetical protein